MSVQGAQRAMIGIIGGSGLYAMQELGTPRARTVTTPFGAPSSPLMTGTLRGREVAFLARHGLQHQLLPGEITSGQYLGAEEPRRAHGDRRVGGGEPARRDPPRRSRAAVAVPGLHQGNPCRELLRRRAGRAYLERAAHLPRHCCTDRARGARRRCGAARGQRPTPASRVAPRHPRGEPVPARGGCGYRRHDQRAGAFLALEAQLGYCTNRGSDRLRLLARGSNTTCVGGTDTEAVAAISAACSRLLAATVAEHQEDESRPCRQRAWRAAHAVRSS